MKEYRLKIQSDDLWRDLKDEVPHSQTISEYIEELLDRELSRTGSDE